MTRKKAPGSSKRQPARPRKPGAGWHLVPSFAAEPPAGGAADTDEEAVGEADAALAVELMRFLTDNPEDAERMLGAAGEAVAEFTALHGREPSTEELLEHIGLGPVDDGALEAWLDGLSADERDELVGEDSGDEPAESSQDAAEPLGKDLKLI